eukprot:5192909-Pyramimonas_sp.AAC.1
MLSGFMQRHPSGLFTAPCGAHRVQHPRFEAFGIIWEALIVFSVASMPRNISRSSLERPSAKLAMLGAQCTS